MDPLVASGRRCPPSIVVISEIYVICNHMWHVFIIFSSPGVNLCSIDSMMDLSCVRKGSSVDSFGR